MSNSLYLTYPLLIFWIVRTIKSILFWLYLWQLKNYHIGRFIDHFKTYQGKKLILNWLLLFKATLLPLIFIQPLFAWIILPIYVAESLAFSLNIVKKNLRKPVFTFKAIFLTLIIFAIIIVYAYAIYAFNLVTILLLLFDILTPIIVSAIVLLVQPFFVLIRKIKLKKATNKIASFKNLKVIAITGSYGKTATKEFLTTILSSKFTILSTPDHKNSEIGIAQTILNNLQEKHQIFIVEMGAYNKGGIKLLCDIVRPNIGIVTGVNSQHLATFGSMENLLSAEGGIEMAEALPKGGLIIINGDNNYCMDLYKNIYKINPNIKKKIYSTNKQKINADIITEDIIVSKDSVTFIARDKEKEMAQFKVATLGRHQVQNLLASILTAKQLGMNFSEISDACQNIKSIQSGANLTTGIYGIDIIDSSYSSNPDGVIADLDYLNTFVGKKVIIMPCLIELGRQSAQVHYKIGKKIAKVCDLAIITTKDKFAEIKKGAMENGMTDKQVLLCDKTAKTLTHITTFCQKDDTVLLEGRVSADLIKLLTNKNGQ